MILYSTPIQSFPSSTSQKPIENKSSKDDVLTPVVVGRLNDHK